MAITNYKKQEETARKTGGIGSATPYSGMSGVSQGTANNLGNYQQGYQQSERVNQAQQNLQQVQAQKPQGYNSKYSGQLESIMQQIQNPQGFKYEFNGDNLFKAYQDLYTQQAKQASMDAMGQAAGLTGGYGSSYGQQVGQQAYQQNLLGLYDKGLEMRDRAYQQYRDQQGDLKDQYSMMQAADESEYGRYRDTVGDWQQEEQLAANREMQERELDYNQYRDALNYYTQLAQIENAAYNTEAERQEAIRQFNEQFAENQRQYDTSMGENQRQFNENLAEERRQYDTSMGENQRQFNENLAENQRQADLDEAYRRDTLAWQQDTDARDYMEKVRQYDANLGEEQRQFNENLAENQRQADIDEKYRRDTLAWQQDTDARDYDEKVRQYNESLAEEQRQANQTDQYRRDTLAEDIRQANLDENYRQQTLAENIREADMDENYRRDTLGWQQHTDARDFDESVRQANMKTAMSYVSAIIGNGQMPSDELLQMAGLSREDAQRMIEQVQAGGTPAPAAEETTRRTPSDLSKGNLNNIWAGYTEKVDEDIAALEAEQKKLQMYQRTNGVGTGEADEALHRTNSKLQDLKEYRAKLGKKN